MSRVFAAKDTVLSRRVVVKVLSPELAEGVSAERFAREIRIAASLQQANIVPVLSTGEANGLPFYTMPFVDGLSLRDRLRRDGPPSLREVANILRDVARALAFAHQQGVVHRDVKPENVLLSGDAAVVTDFGIAKAISEARTASITAPDQVTGITKTGIAIGTPPYMAPEQISGDPNTDHRADIYAFGCLAYELVTGAPPFFGGAPHELFAAHLTQTPPPVTRARAECPPELADLVMRCLEKRPERRPQSARDLLTVLDTMGGSTSGGHAMRVVRRRALGVAAAGVVALVALIALLARPFGATRARSIAVLPLANVGGDSAQEYLADGMADELATALGKMPGARVASRSLSSRYRGRRDVDVRQAGESLAVAYVLQGSLRRVGDKLRVSMQLSSSADGLEVWSESYDRRADEVFALQDAIMRGVAGALKLAPEPPRDARGTTDPEAYDLYLRGQYLLRRRGPGVRLAAENFQRAIERDSSFARAYAGLAAALELFPYFVATPAADVSERAMAAAERALMLDNTISEAHTALGLAKMHVWDWERAASEMKRGVELDPSDPSAHHQYGRLLLYTGRTDSALAEFRKARTIDPYASLYSAWVALALWMQGHQDAAFQEIQRGLQIDSLNPPTLQVATRILMDQRDVPGARAIAARLAVLSPPWNGVAAHLYAKIGDRAQALRILRSLEQRTPRPWFTETGIAYAALGLGDTARVLSALERAMERREIWPTFWPVTDPLYDPVRQAPRFKRLIERVGLTPYVSAAAR